MEIEVEPPVAERLDGRDRKHRGDDRQCVAEVRRAPVHERNAHDQLTPTRLQGLTNYARCLRDHQIPMLDPDPNDGHLSLGNVPGISNRVGRSDPEFQSADAACRSQLPAGVPDDGTGPP